MPEFPPLPQAGEHGPESRLAATRLAAPYKCADCGARATVGATVRPEHGPLCPRGARLQAMRAAVAAA